MNILYLSPGGPMDYQCDGLLHGLRSLAGHTIIDYPRIGHLYTDCGDTSGMYGRGFTLTRLLPEIPLDRSHVPQRIAAREFSLIVYGSIHRSQQYLNEVLTAYPRERILFIDGEDGTDLLRHLIPCGLYFKRELSAPIPGVHPIHFAIPAAKIGTIRPTLKDRVRAASDPRDRSTYIYKDELSYYTDYSRSLFAFTMKKAGWNSMRTLEILANGCIPLFLDLADCPATTLTNLPKPELLEALQYADRDGPYWDTADGRALWQSLWRRIHLRFVYTSTTVALAQYILDIQQQEASKAL